MKITKDAHNAIMQYIIIISLFCGGLALISLVFSGLLWFGIHIVLSGTFLQLFWICLLMLAIPVIINGCIFIPMALSTSGYSFVFRCHSCGYLDAVQRQVFSKNVITCSNCGANYGR